MSCILVTYYFSLHVKIDEAAMLDTSSREAIVLIICATLIFVIEVSMFFLSFFMKVPG
jgi:hypothetical protein